MKQLIILFSVYFFVSHINVQAQEAVTITGIVTKQDGQPIEGVTVKERVNNNATVTDSEGKFKLTLSSDAVSLEVSHIGYTAQVIPVKNKRNIEVTLIESSETLSDVVVVGYGQQKKASLTGAVSVVKGGDLVKSQAVSLTNALTGRVTGYFSKQETGKPGGDAAGFSIRGLNTVGDNSALTIVDGIPRDINSVDPNDIESVSVLKDASAAAIYGVRGSNGVILVTTKRGKVGKPIINYSVIYGLQNPAKPFKWLTAPQYARLANAFHEAIGSSAVYTEEDIDIITNRPDNLLRNAKGWGLANTDWFGALFKNNVPQVQHNLTLSGGGEKAKYFMSIGYLHQNGLFNTADYKRYNLRANIDGQITEEISVKLDVAARLEKRSDIPQGGQLYWPLYEARPTDPIRYPNGLLAVTTNAFNPLAAADSTGSYKTDVNVFQSALTLEYKSKWIKGLALRQVLAADKSFSSYVDFIKPYTYYTYNQTTDIYTKVVKGTTNLTESTSESPALTSQTILEYGWKDKNHSVNAVLVYEAAKQTSNFLQGKRINYLMSTIPELFAGPTSGQTTFGTSSQYARLGQAGRLDYTFNDRYILNFSFRRDGSVNFASDRRYGFFPGASVGWVISKENFFRNISFINNMKIRGSYGQLGNDRLVVRRDDNFHFNFGNNNPFNPSFTNVDFPYLNLFGFGNPYIINGAGSSSLNPVNVPNPNLTWETTTTKEIGLEFSALNNRIIFEGSVYQKRTKDMLNVKSNVPGTFGSSTTYENAGESKVNGYELSVRYSGKIGKADYYISSNLSHSHGVLTKWPDPVGTPEHLKRQGHILFPFTGWVADGLFRTQDELDKALPQYRTLQLGDVRYKDINGDGVINDYDQTLVDKSLVPPTFFGATLGASYKGFDISMLWQGATGFYYAPILAMQQPLFENQDNSPQYLLDYYTSDNTDARFPRLTVNQDPNNSKNSTFWTWDVTYIKLRNIQLGYNLPQKLLSKFNIRQLRVSVTGSNLLTFSNLKDLDRQDPETMSYAWNNNNNNYPLIRVFSFGLNLSF